MTVTVVRTRVAPARQRRVARLPAGPRLQATVVLEGQISITGTGRRQPAPPGTVLLDDGALAHGRVIRAGTGLGLLHVAAEANLMGGVDLGASWRQATGGILPAAAVDRPDVAWLLDRLTAGAGRTETEIRDLARTLFLAIPTTGGRDAARLEHVQLTERVQAHLRAHLGEPEAVTLEALARVAGLSPTHLCTVFGTATGLSPHQHLLQLRLARAEHLLRTTTLSVTDVAYEVGFRHVSHFAAMFRRAMGHPPARHSLLLAAPRRPGLPPIRAGHTPAATTARPGSAHRMQHVALAALGSADGEAIGELRRHLTRPDRRNTALRLLGWVVRCTGSTLVEEPEVLGEALRGHPDSAAERLLPLLPGPRALSAIASAFRNTADLRAVRSLALLGADRALGWVCRGRGDAGLAGALRDPVALGMAMRGTPQAPALARRLPPQGLTALLHGAGAAGIEPLLANGLWRAIPDLFAGVPVQEGLPAARGLLTHPAAEVRRGAILALGHLGDVETLQSLSGGGTPKLRASALLAWGLATQGRRAAHLLAEVRRRPGRVSYEVRSGLLGLGLAYQGTGDAEADDLVATRLGAGEHLFVRRAAVLALGLIHQGRDEGPVATRIRRAVGTERRLREPADTACLIAAFDRVRLTALAERQPPPYGDQADSFRVVLRAVGLPPDPDEGNCERSV